MPHIQWNRIEASIEASSVDPGLPAPLADPLWLLGRQWQVGELTAEDAGTPVRAAIVTQAFPFNHIVVGSDVRPFDPTMPLEAVIEPEPATSPDLRFRLTAGRDLLVALAPFANAAAGLAAMATPPTQTDRTAAALVRALGSRAIDAELVSAQITSRGAGAVAATLAPHADPTAVTAALTAWQNRYLARTGRQAASAWNGQAAAYQFSLTAQTAGAQITLAANGYRGGRLDWSDFTAASAATPGPDVPTTQTIAMPAPLEFKGGPARRYFEIEQGGVSYGMLAGAPTDVGTALLVELALVFGGDWFTLPVTFPVGTLARVVSIAVTDTFNTDIVITQRLRSDGWRMFELAGDPVAQDYLAILPTLDISLEGPAIERLALGRDEAANVVWAIEDTLSDDLGLPVTVEHTSAVLPVGRSYTYEPLIPPPTSWFPLVRRGSGFVGAELRAAPSRTPRGRLLAGWPTIGFLIDDVPAEGLRLERKFQFAIARGQPMRRALWIARSDHNGRGPATSGTLADQLLPPER